MLYTKISSRLVAPCTRIHTHTSSSSSSTSCIIVVGRKGIISVKFRAYFIAASIVMYGIHASAATDLSFFCLRGTYIYILHNIYTGNVGNSAIFFTKSIVIQVTGRTVSLCDFNADNDILCAYI